MTFVKMGAPVKLAAPVSFLGIGSCFIQNLSPYFGAWNIPHLTNPLGTSFNPISIAKQIQWIYDPQFRLDNTIYHNGVYHQLEAAYKHHSTDIVDLEQSLHDIRDKFSLFAKSKPTIIITLGTAHAWCAKGRVVNNCHKLPQEVFKRRLLGLTEIQEALTSALEAIGEQTHVIFTISPVRYTKIGLQENFLGKSTLRLAIEPLLERPQVSYFPSYEIFTDELRDYNFSNALGTHPNDKAVAYIANKFKVHYGI